MVEFFICLIFLMTVFNVILTAQTSSLLVKLADRIKTQNENPPLFEVQKPSNLIEIKAPVQNYDPRFNPN